MKDLEFSISWATEYQPWAAWCGVSRLTGSSFSVTCGGSSPIGPIKAAGGRTRLEGALADQAKRSHGSVRS